MQIVTREIQERQQVLSSVYSVINNMPNESLERILIYIRDITDSKSPADSDCPLSTREKEVLTLIANGYSRKQVGSSLGISSNTAARHISTIYAKLDVSSIAEATRYAIRKGLA